MDDNTKRKLGAAATMAFGAGRIVSGAIMGTGHGLIGAYLRNHGHIIAARLMAAKSIKAGAEMFEDGLDEWKSAS